MIVLFEPQCRGFEHEQFNAAFLWGYRLAYPQSEIVFFAEREHLISVKAILLASNLSLTQLQFKDVIIPNSKSNAKPSVILQYVKLLKIVLDFAVSHNCRKVAFLSIYTYNLIPLKYLLRFKYYNTIKVHIAMHGTLEFIKRKNFTFLSYTYKRLLNYSKKLLKSETKLFKITQGNRFLYEKLFMFSLTLPGNKNIIYYVLREDSLIKINNYLPKEAKYFKFIDHPYIFHDGNFSRSKASSIKLTFATFGKFNKDEIHQLADYLSLKNTNQDNIKLIVIGGDITDELYNYEHVECHFNNRRFSREEFDQISQSVDYFIYLYDEDSYELSTSGAFFDSIAYCKPMVFLSNYCFDHYFEHYNFGYKCLNIDEMLLTIDKVIDNHENNYHGLVAEIRRMQHDKSIFYNYSKLSFSE